MGALGCSRPFLKGHCRMGTEEEGRGGLRRLELEPWGSRSILVTPGPRVALAMSQKPQLQE